MMVNEIENHYQINRAPARKYEGTLAVIWRNRALKRMLVLFRLVMPQNIFAKEQVLWEKSKKMNQ